MESSTLSFLCNTGHICASIKTHNPTITLGPIQRHSEGGIRLLHPQSLPSINLRQGNRGWGGLQQSRVGQRRHAFAGEGRLEGGDEQLLQSRRYCECYDQYDMLVPYVDAWRWQKSKVEEKVGKLGGDEDGNDILIILQHPEVYTLGTRSSEAFLKFDPKDSPFELHRTERGGEVTFHGPGQLVMYPILNLRHHKMDLHWYLRTLEEVVIGALAKSCGIQAHRIDGLTGVWVENQKVAAIGVRVSRWITYHGVALNVTTNLESFSNIIPCGISEYSVTSVAKLLQYSLSPSKLGQESADDLLAKVHDSLLSEFEEQFRVVLVVPPTKPGPRAVCRTWISELM